MLRRSLLALLLMAAASGVLYRVGFVQPSPGDPAACAGLPSGETRATCFEQVLLSSGSLDRVWPRFVDVVSEDASLHDDCHLATHRAGKQLAVSVPVTVDLLREFAFPLCSWGLGHGLFEGFARLETSPADWFAAAEVCRGFLSGADGVGALCGDGYGHAVWMASEDFRDAVDGCSRLDDGPLAEACVGGVMMQRFRPADRSGVASSSGVAPGDVLAVCEESRFAGEWFVPGCLSGAGYVLVQDVIEDASASGASLESLSEGFAVLSDLCAASIDRDLCVASLTANLPAGFSFDSSTGSLCRVVMATRRCA